jgi:hypothetical protein
MRSDRLRKNCSIGASPPQRDACDCTSLGTRPCTRCTKPSCGANLYHHVKLIVALGILGLAGMLAAALILGTGLPADTRTGFIPDRDEPGLHEPRPHGVDAIPTRATRR